MKRLLLLTVSLFFIGAGCTAAQPRTEVPPSPSITEPIPAAELSIIKLERGTYSAEIAYDNQSPRFVSQWESASTTEQIIINGAFFHEDYTPSGFLVVNGKRVGERMFDQDKSGLLVISETGASIRDLTVSPIQPNERFDFALQSYPFLIKNGMPAVQTDSGLKARRTVVGIDAEQSIYVIVLTADEISLYECMNKLMATGIPFVHVLNLDGGPSTGIFADWGEHQFFINSFTPVSSVVRFMKK